MCGVPKVQELDSNLSPRNQDTTPREPCFSPRELGLLTPRDHIATSTPRSIAVSFTPRTNPSDCDATNTHDSSLSEQAWDPYQEHQYLSEPYSEDFDDDAARRLLNFGDDYSKFIDSDDSSLLFPAVRKNRR